MNFKTIPKLAVLVGLMWLLSPTSAHAFYNPSTGRWLSRDPIEEGGGMNILGFNRNDAIKRIDALGRFTLGDHATLTRISFWEAIYVLQDHSDVSCQQGMLRTMISANRRQDWLHFADLKRHYNRSAFADDYGDKWAADEAYERYLLGEKINFISAISQSPSHRTCDRALRALGRMTHSWQDFFAHAIRRDGAGGMEPGSQSSSEGWLAWTMGVTGNPDARANFWPSSYPGEHPWFSEPIVPGGAEYLARFEAAEDYVRQQLVTYLPRWFEHCRCFCP